MSTYKIHPPIGIMRVGNSPDAIFIGPESPGHAGFDFTPGTGVEQPLTKYKANGLIKRQAARFTVWEYDDQGTAVREVTSASAEIVWSVELANKKAAGNNLVSLSVDGRSVLVPGNAPRNAGIPRADVTIQDPNGARSIQGENQIGPEIGGSFLGKAVKLGNLYTDSAGRLVVAGGHGKSEGIPLTAGGPIPSLGSFANNNRWYDDVSDGPVRATVRIGGAAPVEAAPAWVLAAPPDFAPGLGSLITLWEVVREASAGPIPARPSFRRDIHPILQRAVGFKWVHDWSYWSQVSTDWAALSSLAPGDPALRQATFDLLNGSSIHEFAWPSSLLKILQSWVDGDYEDDWATPLPSLSGPAPLDQAALGACVGANFFPGIEAGYLITQQRYAEPFRLSHTNIEAGALTLNMALPWQADFNDCADDWWPSQRPNEIYPRPVDVPDNEAAWALGVYTGQNSSSRAQMVANYGKFGFVIRKEEGAGEFFLETERASTLPPR